MLFAEPSDTTLVDRIQYLSLLMTLSWLARRTRYDILLAISHLSTRCQSPTKSDQLKLNRVLGYVLGTRDKADECLC